MTTPSAAARRALDGFVAAWNDRDPVGVRASCNYPHVQVAGGRVTVAGGPDELAVDFDALAAAEGWHHTDFDDVHVVAEGPAAVELAFTYARVDGAGVPYFTGRAHYVFTLHDGHWGRQVQLLFDR